MTQSNLLMLCAAAAAAGYYFWKIKPAPAVAVTSTPSQDSASLLASVAQLQKELDAAKAVVPSPT